MPIAGGFSSAVVHLPSSSPNLPPLLHWRHAHGRDPHSGFSFFHSALDSFQTTAPHSHFLGDYSLCLSSTFQHPYEGSSPTLVRIPPSCTSLLNVKTLDLLLGIFLAHQDDQGPHQYLISGLLALIQPQHRSHRLHVTPESLGDGFPPSSSAPGKAFQQLLVLPFHTFLLWLRSTHVMVFSHVF